MTTSKQQGTSLTSKTGGVDPPPPVANNVVTFAGSTSGYLDGTGNAWQFNLPRGLCKDASGNIYVADYGNHKIRKITSAGVVTTFAGSSNGYLNGMGTAAQFSYPFALCMDSAGNIFVSEAYGRIRKITPAGIVSTYIYLVNTLPSGITYSPDDICIDSLDNIYVADINNDVILKITTAGAITTFAGSTVGYLDGTGTAAKFNNPAGICSDSANNIYISDSANFKVRKITSASVVTTLSGSSAGYADGSATTAHFNNLAGMCTQETILYVTDDNRIRKVTLNTGTEHNGWRSLFWRCRCSWYKCQFNQPQGLVFANSKLCVTDTFNHKVKTVTP